MAESRDAEATIASKAIQLPSRPATSDCLSWSAEHLASAGGEFVHIIDTTSKDLRFETVRINKFEDSDGKVEPANGRDFSIGREQSSAKAVAISFSSVGLGIHSRAVLAVLTANHLLSFWEHTGKPSSWHRTCVVNSSGLLGSSADGSAQPIQIYAFTWLPPIRLGQGENQTNAHFLAFIDDDQNLWVVRVFKSDRTNKAKWQVSHVHKEPILIDNEVINGQPLTSPLAHNAYAFDLLEQQRSQEFYDNHGVPIMARIRLLFKKQGYRPDPRGFLSVTLTWELEADDLHLTTRASGFASEELSEISPHDFMDVVAELAQSYDREWSLQGHYAIHWMGFATSLDRAHIAACVVFKPSASPVYTQPRDEKSTVLIASTGQAAEGSAPVSDPRDVQSKILQHLAHRTDLKTIITDTDIKIVRVGLKMINELFPSDAGLVGWSAAAEQLLTLFDSNERRKSDQSEVCEICRISNRTADLEITDDGRRGKCATGHGFYRCGITFLAIQDPGICKHCIKCRRQFLCYEQVEAEEGPSLGSMLLDECGAGLCPYCQGYFCDS